MVLAKKPYCHNGLESAVHRGGVLAPDGGDQFERLLDHFLWLVAKQIVGARLVGVSVEVLWMYPKGLRNGRQYAQIRPAAPCLPARYGDARDAQAGAQGFLGQPLVLAPLG